VKWFIKAARQGNKIAQHNLGLHYAAAKTEEPSR
jgi:TPR repeat protein